MRVLLWHVHGSWTTSFVQGPHEYVVPVTPDRGPDGRGRAQTWQWPDSVVEVPPERLADEPVDMVLLQRPHELDLCARWLRRRPGQDVPAVFLEHNTPGGEVARTRHPLADQHDVPIVHVTHFNRLFWDCGTAATSVIEHGIVDPGPLYTGEQERAAVVINDPVRRGRAVGTDLLPTIAEAAPVDLFGINVDLFGDETHLPASRVATHVDVTQEKLHRELASRRVYVHTSRWTSLGLSLLEAMHLGMPVVALDTTEVSRAVPPEAGVVSASPEELAAGVRRFVADLDAASAAGAAARRAALERYGLERFLADWDRVLGETVSSESIRTTPRSTTVSNGGPSTPASRPRTTEPSVTPSSNRSTTRGST
ncbi:MAG TPA: glycosyltransferase family 4 protein [Nocardioidaceae bacterium]|nr:glycosyltransferase family 4 protein [Nocardioidaceae bacterium]